MAHEQTPHIARILSLLRDAITEDDDDDGHTILPSLCRMFKTEPAATYKFLSFFLSFFLSILSRSNFDHHLRCGGWLNFEFS